MAVPAAVGCWCGSPATRRVIYAQKSDGALRGARVCKGHVADEQVDIEDLGHKLHSVEVLRDSNLCPDVSAEGLICTLAAGHPGDTHKDQTDPATEIQWRQAGRVPRHITLGELSAHVDEKVRARAAALLAQAPSPSVRGTSASLAILDEVPASAYAAAAVPRAASPGISGLLASLLGLFVPGRRPISGERRPGNS